MPMSTKLEFDDNVSRLIEAGYTIPDIVRRRSEVVRVLDPRSGEQVMDIGCGPGFLSADLAAAVGPSGHVCAVDASSSMIKLARQRCAHQAWVEVKQGDAVEIPVAARTVDAAISIQVYEYVPDVAKAIAELYRVLRPGGRALVLDTDWESVVWNNSDPQRMARVLVAWNEHVVHSSLPRTLTRDLRDAGFRVRSRQVHVLFNPDLDPNTYSGFIMGGIVGFVPGRRGVTPEEAAAWAEDLIRLGQEGTYFFSLNEYIFVVEKPEKRRSA